MKQTLEEVWETIPEFPRYEISNLGRIYNSKARAFMSPSLTNHGHMKITLVSESGGRQTRSVAVLVGEAFVEAPNVFCDQLIMLDGHLTHIAANNLAWRPRWFAWKYVRQLKIEQPIYYRNLRVTNLIENVEYQSIIHAGMIEGLLFDDIWRSTYSGVPVFPYGSIFEVTERV
jgi:hypothetical protein